MFSFIIINYKQKELLFKCIESIYDVITSNQFEIVIINNSPKEDLSELTVYYNSLAVINNNNKGYSQANNFGVLQAKYDYLVFLNADTIVKADFTTGFLDCFKNKDFGAVGLKLLNTDESFQLSYWKENTFFNEIVNKRYEGKFRNKNKLFLNKNEINEIKEVEWVSGASLIIKKDIYKNIGGFDERYFLFYEDADLCKRLKDNGYKIYFYPFCKIIHFKGENINKDFLNKTYYYAKKSQLLYYKLHNSLIDRILLRMYLFMKFILRLIVKPNTINKRVIKLVCGINEDKNT